MPLVCCCTTLGSARAALSDDWAAPPRGKNWDDARAERRDAARKAFMFFADCRRRDDRCVALRK